MTKFFRRYAALGAVINGVQVRSFVHSDCIKRILTGTPSDTNPDLGAIVAYEHGRDLPVPYLVLGNSALSGPLAAYTARAGTTNQIATLLNESAATADDTALTGDPAFLPTSNEDALVARYLNASAERVRAVRGQRGANAHEVEALPNRSNAAACSGNSPKGVSRAATTRRTSASRSTSRCARSNAACAKR